MFYFEKWPHTVCLRLVQVTSPKHVSGQTKPELQTRTRRLLLPLDGIGSLIQMFVFLSVVSFLFCHIYPSHLEGQSVAGLMKRCELLFPLQEFKLTESEKCQKMSAGMKRPENTVGWQAKNMITLEIQTSFHDNLIHSNYLKVMCVHEKGWRVQMRQKRTEDSEVNAVSERCLIYFIGKYEICTLCGCL